MVLIDYLKNHPRHLKSVVDWVYNEWWKYRKGYSFRQVFTIYSELLNDDALPVVLVALKGNQAVGSVLLSECDPYLKINLRPWIEDLFVKPDCRGQGIGKELVMRAEQIAADLGYRQLYLSTHIDKYYENMGWDTIKKLRNNDTLMQYTLQNSLCRAPAAG